MRKISGDSVAESIVADICYNHQFDIFGFSLLDPEAFGKRMKFSINYLRQKHPSPFQRQIEGSNLVASLRKRPQGFLDGNVLLCDDRIRNALYVLTHYPFTMYSITEAEGKLIKTYESFTILDKFYIIQNEKTGKLRYGYHVNDSFLLALNRYYLYVDLTSLRKLRASGLGGLYFYLINVAQAVFSKGAISTNSENTPSFSKLCKLAEINGMNPKDNKRHLKDALKKINNETDLNFSVKWIRDKGAWAYVPIFTFVPRSTDLVACNHRSIVYKEDNEMLKTLTLELKHNLYSACPKGKNPFDYDAETTFNLWISGLNEENDAENIRRILANSFYRCGCEIPKDLDKRVKNFIFNSANKKACEFDQWLPKVIVDPGEGFTYKIIDIGNKSRP